MFVKTFFRRLLENKHRFLPTHHAKQSSSHGPNPLAPFPTLEGDNDRSPLRIGEGPGVRSVTPKALPSLIESTPRNEFLG